MKKYKIKKLYEEIKLISKFAIKNIYLGTIPKINLLDYTTDSENETAVFEYEFFLKNGDFYANIKKEKSNFNKKLNFKNFDYKTLKERFEEEYLVFEKEDYDLLKNRIIQLNKNIKLDISSNEDFLLTILKNINTYMIKNKDTLSVQELQEIKYITDLLKKFSSESIVITPLLKTTEKNIEYFENISNLPEINEIDKEIKFKNFIKEQKIKKEWLEELRNIVKTNNSKIKDKQLKQELRNKLKKLGSDFNLISDNEIIELIDYLENKNANLVPEEILDIYFGKNYLDKAENLDDQIYGIENNISKEELITKLLQPDLVVFDKNYINENNLLNENIRNNLKEALPELVGLLEQEIKNIEESSKKTGLNDEFDFYIINTTEKKIKSLKNILQNLEKINFNKFVSDMNIKKYIYETKNGYYLNKEKFLQDIIKESEIYLKQTQNQEIEQKM